jgi:hypothetical protein
MRTLHDALHKIPGVWMLVGSSAPTGTISSTSATVTFAGGRHHRIEIARRHAVDEIAFRIAFPRLDDRKIGAQPAFENIGLAVELFLLLALGDQRADPRLGVEAGNARAACANALGQRALRIEFEFELAGQILLLERLVLAHIGTDHLLDLARLQQQAEPEIVDAGIVGDDGQIASRRNRASRGSDFRECRTGRNRRT